MSTTPEEPNHSQSEQDPENSRQGSPPPPPPEPETHGEIHQADGPPPEPEPGPPEPPSGSGAPPQTPAPGQATEPLAPGEAAGSPAPGQTAGSPASADAGPPPPSQAPAPPAAEPPAPGPHTPGPSAPGAYGHSSPAYGHSSPAYGHSGPAYPHSGPAYGHAGPTYGHSAPTYGAPPPGRVPGRSPFSSLGQPVTWKVSLVPAGLALLGGLLVSIVLAVLVNAIGDFSGMGEELGVSTSAIGYALPFVLLALALGGSGAIRLDASIEGAGNLDGSLHIAGMPLLITGVMLGLLWWLTKRSETKNPSPNRATTWLRIGLTTLPLTLVLFLLQLIFAARLSVSEFGAVVSFEFSAVTARSFFLPLLVIAVTAMWGRMAGHFKGTEAIGAPFLRWTVPAGLVALVHLAVSAGLLALVALFVLPLGTDTPGQLVPLIFLNAGLIFSALAHLAGITLTGGGDVAGMGNSASESLTLFSAESGLLWLVLIVTAVSVLIAALVSTATRRPYWTVAGEDRQLWSKAWQTPVAFMVLWGLLSLLVIPVRMRASGAGEMMDLMDGGLAGGFGVSLGALPWTFLLLGLWGAVVEVLSRTVGARLVMTFPAVTKLLTGRAVHPYWGSALQMSEPRNALIHPDIAAEAAAPPQAPPPTGSAPGGPGDSAPPPPGSPAQTQGYPTQPLGAPQTGSVPPPPHHPAPPQGAAGQGSVPPPPHQPVPGYGSAGYAAAGYAPPPPPPGPLGPAAPSGPAGAAAPAGPAQPFDRARTTRIGIIAGAAVVALVAGIITVTQVNARAFGPESVVANYFSHLSDGNAQAALELADVDVPAEQRSLLTDDVLANASARPTDVTVEDSEITDDTARVDVSYDIGGAKSSVSLSLYRAGRSGLFFDDWRLQSPGVDTLTVGASGLDTVKVNGVDVPTGESGVELPAFPGLYTVGLAEESDFVTAEEVQARVFFSDSGGQEEPVSLDAEPTDALRSEVEDQVQSLLDSCAEETSPSPDGCPFSTFRDDLTNISWSVESYPTVTVDMANPDYGDESSAWRVSTEETGEAHVTGQYESFGGSSQTYESTETVNVSGTAEIVDGAVVFTLESSGY